jgi:hypothetical protein
MVTLLATMAMVLGVRRHILRVYSKMLVVQRIGVDVSNAEPGVGRVQVPVRNGVSENRQETISRSESRNKSADEHPPRAPGFYIPFSGGY